MKKILTVLFAAALLGPIQALELIKEGKLQLDGIVLAANATSSEQQAAKELVHHLKKSTGTEVPLITEPAELKPGQYIFLGACSQNQAVPEWAKNCGRITITANAIHIAGKDSPYVFTREDASIGTLFAAYEFLEKFLGVKWLWPGELGEVVPEHKNLAISEAVIDTKPKIPSSYWRHKPISKDEAWNSKENMAKYYEEQLLWLKRHRFSCDGASFMHGHAFTDYFTRYGQSNPEYFNLLPDGTRRSNPYNWSKGHPQHVSMCVTNPGLHDRIVENWQLKKPKTINLNENDSSGSCVCAACLAADNSSIPDKIRLERATKRFNNKEKGWENELGSVSDRYSRFYLAVQQKADLIDPEHHIMGLVYANYSQPPSDKIKLNERITLRFCPPFMYPWTDRKLREYKEIWGGWANTGAKLMFRPNFTLDGNCFPVQYQDAFYEMFTFSYKHGLVATDMDSLTGHYAAQGLVNYVIASLNHDPERPLAELENEFFTAFGPAANPVKTYFDLMKQASMKSGFKDPFNDTLEGGILFIDILLVADTIFTPRVMQSAKSMLATARKTPNLSAEEAQRVDFLISGLTNVELTLAAQAECRKYKKNGDIKPLAEAIRKLDAYRASIEGTNALNVGHLRFLEDRHWPQRASLPVN